MDNTIQSIGSVSSTDNITFISNPTITLNQWSTPERVDIIENSDSIEFIYKETSMFCYTSFPAPPPQVRVFKIVYSCVDGKWNKSDRIYGQIIPAQNEQYVFDE